MSSKWWTWNWDRRECPGGDVTYDQVTRWRRGWVTVYKLVTHHVHEDTVEWRVYLPFNLNVGVEYDVEKKS